MTGDIREAQGRTPAEVVRRNRSARTVSGEVRCSRVTIGIDSSTVDLHGDGFSMSVTGVLDPRDVVAGMRYAITLTRLDEVMS